jgi:hypothetical protein
MKNMKPEEKEQVNPHDNEQARMSEVSYHLSAVAPEDHLSAVAPEDQEENKSS